MITALLYVLGVLASIVGAVAFIKMLDEVFGDVSTHDHDMGFSEYEYDGVTSFDGPGDRVDG